MPSAGMTAEGETPAEAGRWGPIRDPKNLLAGLALLAVSGFTLWTDQGLSQGTLRVPGPGLFPTSAAVLLAICGGVLVFGSLIRGGAALERWNVRSLFFLGVGLLSFAVTIRSVGLLLAGPLVTILSSLASEETRLKESLVVAAVLTALCILIFKYALGLPLPILKIRGVINL